MHRVWIGPVFICHRSITFSFSTTAISHSAVCCWTLFFLLLISYVLPPWLISYWLLVTQIPNSLMDWAVFWNRDYSQPKLHCVRIEYRFLKNKGISRVSCNLSANSGFSFIFSFCIASVTEIIEVVDDILSSWCLSRLGLISLGICFTSQFFHAHRCLTMSPKGLPMWICETCHAGLCGLVCQHRIMTQERKWLRSAKWFVELPCRLWSVNINRQGTCCALGYYWRKISSQKTTKSRCYRDVRWLAQYSLWNNRMEASVREVWKMEERKEMNTFHVNTLLCNTCLTQNSSWS